MNLTGTQTFVNLARSFAGESQARNRYSIYEEILKNEGYYCIARMIAEIEKNEQSHAKVFFDFIASGSPEVVDNIQIDAGYPFQYQTAVENLKYAARGEQEEYETIYPNFAKTAAEEGFPEIARVYEMIAGIEQAHHRLFMQMYTEISTGTLYKKDESTTWKCSNCGYEHSSAEAWKICPVCKHPQGFVFPQIKFSIA